LQHYNFKKIQIIIPIQHLITINILKSIYVKSIFLKILLTINIA